MKRCGLAFLLLVASAGCSEDERRSHATVPWAPLPMTTADTGCEGEAVVRPASPVLVPIDGVPVTPLGRVIDHVVEIEATVGPRVGAYPFRLTRRGDWMRRDTLDQQEATSTYSNNTGRAWLRVSNNPVRKTSSVLVQPQQASRDTTYRVERDIGREKIAGETCDRWRVTRRLGSGATDSTTACLTEDGLQLRQAAVADWDTPYVFRKIERRCVASAEVTPPIGLIDIRPSLGLDDPGPTTGAANYEVVLETTGPNGLGERRIVRRRGAVVLTDIWSSAGQRRISIFNAARGLSWQTGFGPEGRAGDMMLQQGPPDDRRRLEHPRLKDRPESWVLGEACHWRDASASMGDATREICETADGIILIEAWTSWGQPRPALRAVRLTRGGVTPDQVSPPPELMKPEYWGFPIQ